MALLRQSALVCSRLLLNQLNKPQITDSRNIKRWVAPTLKELQRRRNKLGPEPEKARSKFLEWNYDAEIFAFGKRLGEEFNKDVLKQALTHKAYVNLEAERLKNEGIENFSMESNSDLISEGDDLISKYVKSELGKKYPSDAVNALHDYLTSEQVLAHVALHMGLKDLVLTPEFPVDKATLSSTFKAVVAALNKSQNLERAQLFIKDFLISQLNGKEIFDVWHLEKPYEYLMRILNTELEPRLCNQSAVNTVLANYQVGLYNNEKKLVGIGWGESIEIAKDTAALDAIQRFYNIK